MMTPRMAGFSSGQSPASLVTVMKSAPKINAGDAGDLEQSRGERRLRRAGGVGNVERAVRHHMPAGEEFEGRRIGREFGLDEHSSAPNLRFKAGTGGNPYMGEEFCGSKP